MVQAAFKLDSKTLRLDDKRLERWVQKEQVKPLTRYGSILRRHARRSIKTVAPTKGMLERLQSDDPRKRKRAQQTLAKRREKVSQPGKPPISHSHRKDSFSIRNIQYGYDTRTQSMVAGPVKFGAQGKDVPKTLEGGGTAVVYRIFSSGAWRFTSARVYKKWNGKKKMHTVTIKPRPTMGLALRATEKHLLPQFRAR